MSHHHKLPGFILILILLIPLFFVNQVLQKALKPRQSYLRLMIYLLAVLGLVFIYTYLLVWAVAHLFPLQ
jgi:hypothetical protein